MSDISCRCPCTCGHGGNCEWCKLSAVRKSPDEHTKRIAVLGEKNVAAIGKTAALAAVSAKNGDPFWYTVAELCDSHEQLRDELARAERGRDEAIATAKAALHEISTWPESTPGHTSITSQDVPMRKFAHEAYAEWVVADITQAGKRALAQLDKVSPRPEARSGGTDVSKPESIDTPNVGDSDTAGVNPAGDIFCGNCGSDARLFSDPGNCCTEALVDHLREENARLVEESRVMREATGENPVGESLSYDWQKLASESLQKLSTAGDERDKLIVEIGLLREENARLSSQRDALLIAATALFDAWASRGRTTSLMVWNERMKVVMRSLADATVAASPVTSPALSQSKGSESVVPVRDPGMTGDASSLADHSLSLGVCQGCNGTGGYNDFNGHYDCDRCDGTGEAAKP